MISKFGSLSDGFRPTKIHRRGTERTGVAAIGIFPPGLPGFNIGWRPALWPAGARQLFGRSKYGNNLPPIVYTDAGIGSTLVGTWAALGAMWQQVLGVGRSSETWSPITIMRDNRWSTRTNFWRWLCAGLSDPENFADVLFHSESTQNTGGYSNPELDALLERARVEQDVTKRIEMYQQAEADHRDDAPVLFTTTPFVFLVKPYVRVMSLPYDVPVERYYVVRGTWAYTCDGVKLIQLRLSSLTLNRTGFIICHVAIYHQMTNKAKRCLLTLYLFYPSQNRLFISCWASHPERNMDMHWRCESLSNERVNLSTSTLYTAIGRLLDQEWIERLFDEDEDSGPACRAES